MSDSSNWLVHDHRKHEAALEECEMAAGAGDWKDAVRLFDRFVDDLNLHMRMEDVVIYPLFVEQVDDVAEDIIELTEEHAQIAWLMRDLAFVIKRKDMDHFEGSLSPLYKALTRHNGHEEEVFLGKGNDALLMQRDDILARLKSLETSSNHRSCNS